MIDRVVADLAHAWVSEENRLGIEIDARTLTYHASRGNLGFDISPLSTDAAFSLLWLRGAKARIERLEHWHPYRSDIVVERQALEHAVRQIETVVDVTQTNWVAEYSKKIEEGGLVVLSAPYESRDRLASGIREVTVTPIDRNGLRTYARVTGVRHRHGTVLADLSVAEELQ